MAQTPTLPLLISSLTALSLPTPTSLFLNPILTPSSHRPPPPLAALTATAKHRLLSASITSTPSSPSILIPSTPSFPTNISEVRIQERVLDQDIFVQVLDILDLGRGKWEQIESLEAQRRGESMKGREIIRVVPVEQDQDASSTSTQVLPNGQARNTSGDKGSKGPFKLLLQDWKGVVVWGFEVRKVERIMMPPGMGIGCKLLLKRGVKVARGMVLLEPGMVVVLGGKIEGMDKAWRGEREERLRREVVEERRVEG
ncbi:uncharacterized protein RAG0_07175 [Rhynchosporium agropyri]|uniref:RecQ mediated genome instability protein 1 OB-fold domain-containing protein n=1 Tax=Rhynchosporium agropyri TaxID=914238 RepID=A0A1E1KK52_9HELO|nr:uncharacterized protein RAG0_07175 [Rhynchosporium agropyri]